MEEIVKVCSYFPCLVSEEENEELFVEVILAELEGILWTFQKGKNLGPNGWTTKFFIIFFDYVGHHPLRVVEEIKTT
jgi:hypothetical protein